MKISKNHRALASAMPRTSRDSHVLEEILGPIVVLAGLATVLGGWGRVLWIGELASHFRVQYFWLLSASAILFWFHKRKQTQAFLALTLALVNFWGLVPFYHKRPAVLSQETFRVLQANVLWSSSDDQRLRQFIQEAEPDVIMLEEVTREWLQSLEGLLLQYPFSHAIPRSDPFGIMLLSRIPIERVRTVSLGDRAMPAVIAQLYVNRQPLTIIGSHTLPPISPRLADLRNQQLDELAVLARAQETAVLLLGDLNSTPWSPIFVQFLKKARLRDGRKGFGICPTWPAGWPFIQIPIDHCLVSSEISVTDWKKGPNIGSDHYPIVVEFFVSPMPAVNNRDFWERDPFSPS